MKILSLFSGIGAFEKALDRVGIDYELVNYCEIDKYASKSYAAIHNVSENLNLGDITKVNEKELKDFDFMSWGFPCTDISVAGKQKGFIDENGNQTRSGLYYDGLRILKEKRPKISMIENVKNLTSKKFRKEFETVLSDLNDVGYNNYWAVLNAKDYGIPQNRERVFIVSIRKDIDDGNFKFPDGFPLELRLKDILDNAVEEKYYLKKTLNIVAKENYLQWDNSGKGHNSQQNRGYYQDGLCPTLSCCNNNGDKSQVVLRDKAEIIRIDIPQTVKVRKYDVNCELLCECLRNHKSNSNLSNKEIAETLNVPITKVEHWFRQDEYFAIPDEDIWFDLKNILNVKTNEFDESIMTFEEREGVYEKSNRCYHENGIAPTLTSTSADEKIIIDDMYANREPRIYDEYSPTLRSERHGLKVADKPSLVGGIGEKNFGKQYRQGNRIYDSNAVAMALTASPVGSVGGNSYLYQLDNLKIRKLTPKECFRLMGFDDEDFEKAAKINSNAQLYKQAGNSICVNVLEAIFKNLKVYLEK